MLGLKKNIAVMIFMFVMLFCLVEKSAFASAKTEEAVKGGLGAITIYTTGGATLAPPFSSAVHKYKAYVNNDIENIAINAIAANAESEITINGKTVPSGKEQLEKLAVGKNRFKIVVAGEDGVLQEYILMIVREDISKVVAAFTEGSYTDAQTGTTMSYRLFKPEGYTPLKEYPMVVFLHGSGEYGTDNKAQILANQGATIWAKPEEQAKHPCLVLAPQASHSWLDEAGSGEDGKPLVSDLDMVPKLVERITKLYHVDRNRIYATGVSDGGIAVWSLNEANPDLFAAMVPVCGGGDKEQAYKLVNKPIWAFHGEADPVIPVNDSREMIAALRALGGTPLFTEYPRETYLYPMAHYSWVRAYQTQEMRDWLFRQVKMDA